MVRKAGLIVNDGKDLAVQTAISVEKKLKKSNKDLLLKNLINAKSINEIKKLIKKNYKNYKNYIITKKNFNIKNSL